MKYVCDKQITWILYIERKLSVTCKESYIEAQGVFAPSIILYSVNDFDFNQLSQTISYN